jgi:hypothetical protein
VIGPRITDQGTQLFFGFSIRDGDGRIITLALDLYLRLKVAEGDTPGLPRGIQGKVEQRLK